MSIPAATTDLSSGPSRRAQRVHGPADVEAAIHVASERTGVDFSYLVEKAAVESSFRPDLTMTSSSATGLYQFINSTWLETLKAHGTQHGYGRYADAIKRSDSGRYFVADPELRQQVMDLRKDPKASALMVAELTRDNVEYLKQKVGGAIGKTELYMAHFLGPAGASKFLNAMRANPNQTAKDLFPEAASSNPAVFNDRKTGRPTTLAQIYDRFAGKFDESGTAAVVGPAGSGFAALEPSKPSGTSGPLNGQMISMYTMLALAALETPLDNRHQAKTAFDSRKVGSDLSPDGSLNEFQRNWQPQKLMSRKL